MRTARRLAFLLLAAGLLAPAASADNWPAWRGPTGQGHSPETGLPVKWSAAQNVKWKVPLADQGNSTPVVWGDKIFLTQANKGGSVRSLLCLARTNGEQLWKKDVSFGEKEQNWNQSWYDNASPATDGERVVVSHGSAGVFCYDFTGKELWKRTDLGTWQHAFGNSASPVLYENLAIQWCGPNDKGGGNTLVAMNKATGETVWKHDESFGSWSTPVVAKVGGKDQLVLGQSRDVKSAPEEKYGKLKGFDPKTGSELWSCRGLNSYVYSSALVGNGVAVGMSGYGGSAMAVKLGGTGDITGDRLWLHPKPANQRVGSGVIVGDHVYMIDENALPRCYELKTGKNLWEKEEALTKKVVTWGSLVHADGRLYIMMRNGETVVLAASPKFEVLATNPLDKGAQTNSSPAVAGGEIYLRTFTHLWCIANKK